MQRYTIIPYLPNFDTIFCFNNTITPTTKIGNTLLRSRLIFLIICLALSELVSKFAANNIIQIRICYVYNNIRV